MRSIINLTNNLTNKSNKSNFHNEFTFEKRKTEASRILIKYPDRIPVIVQLLENSNFHDIKKNKYLVPSYITIGQFLYIIRKQIILEPEQAIFIFVNNTILPTSSLLSQVYKEHKEMDGFLYFFYDSENCFGRNI